MNEQDHSAPRLPIPPVVPLPGEDLAPIEASPVYGPYDLPPRRRRWGLPLTLFVATCLSTYFGYAFYNDWVFRGVLNHTFREAIELIARHWYVPKALIYSVCVMTILGCHEMGHFLQARRYGVRTSLPIFLPMPFTPIGTLGAVIAMDSRVANRRALFDIGITGPAAGLVPTLLFCLLGLQFGWSELAPLPPVALEPGNPYVFGEPLLFQWLSWLVFGPRPEGFDIVIGPMAFAGWVGLLITALNLIPIGQLDGGHILYALFRRRAHAIATTLLLAAVAATVVYGLFGWWLMLLLLILMGPKHPPTSDDNVALGKLRVVLGWAMLAFLPLGFTPNPFPGLQGPEPGDSVPQQQGEPPTRRPLAPPSPDDRWVRRDGKADPASREANAHGDWRASPVTTPILSLGRARNPGLRSQDRTTWANHGAQAAGRLRKMRT
jgi:Zn-dependent protease